MQFHQIELIFLGSSRLINVLICILHIYIIHKLLFSLRLINFGNTSRLDLYNVHTMCPQISNLDCNVNKKKQTFINVALFSQTTFENKDGHIGSTNTTFLLTSFCGRTHRNSRFSGQILYMN